MMILRPDQRVCVPIASRIPLCEARKNNRLCLLGTQRDSRDANLHLYSNSGDFLMTAARLLDELRTKGVHLTVEGKVCTPGMLLVCLPGEVRADARNAQRRGMHSSTKRLFDMLQNAKTDIYIERCAVFHTTRCPTSLCVEATSRDACRRGERVGSLSRLTRGREKASASAHGSPQGLGLQVCPADADARRSAHRVDTPVGL